MYIYPRGKWVRTDEYEVVNYFLGPRYTFLCGLDRNLSEFSRYQNSVAVKESHKHLKYAFPRRYAEHN